MSRRLEGPHRGQVRARSAWRSTRGGDFAGPRPARRADRSVVERLEDRRLLSITPQGDAAWRLIGITGNKQADDFEDETLYEIDLAGTRLASLDGFEDVSNPPPAIL